MKRITLTLLTTLITMFTGCGQTDNPQVIVHKQVKYKKIPDGVNLEEMFVQVPQQTTGELAYVIHQVSSDNYMDWESLMAKRIYAMRDQLKKMGYDEYDIGIKYQNGIPVLLANTVHSKIEKDMRWAVLDSGLVEPGDHDKLQVMVRLYNTLLLYNVLNGKVNGIDRINKLTLPELSEGDFDLEVVGTEYDILGKSYSEMMLEVLAVKHDLSPKGVIEVAHEKNYKEWKDSLTILSEESSFGKYAYLDNSPKHKAYKRIIDTLSAMDYILFNYEDIKITMMDNYYTNYGI